MYLPKMLDGKFPSPHIDGLKIIDSPTFGEELRAYLESPYPLVSCKYCLGTVGKLFPHSQVKRSEWRQLQQVKHEDMVDMEELAALEKNLNHGGDWFPGFKRIASRIKPLNSMAWRIKFINYMIYRYGYMVTLKKLIFDY
jgi:hypothetical protein